MIAAAQLLTITPLPDDGSLPTWDEQVSGGIEDVRLIDERRWSLGRRASRVDRRYGEGSLKKFAGEINISYDRLYAYQRVFEFYGGYCTDVDILSWSHYREAMRIKDVYAEDEAAARQHALRLLTRAADRAWVVDRFIRIIRRYMGRFYDRPYQPRGQQYSGGGGDHHASYDNPAFECRAVADADGQLHVAGMMNIKPGVTYILRAYEVLA